MGFRVFRSFASSTLSCMKKVRSENNYTFSTRFPRKPRSIKSQHKKPGKRTPITHAKVKNLPEKLKLASVKSHVYNKVDDKKRKRVLKQKRLSDELESQRVLVSTNQQSEINATRALNLKQGESLHTITMARFNLNQKLLAGLRKEFAIERPNYVQTISIPQVLDKKQDVYIGAETGTGKTLAYLLPIMHQLLSEDSAAYKKHESLSPEEQCGRDPLGDIRHLKRPRAVILVPSRDLVSQVTEVAKKLSYHAPMTVVGVHGKMLRRIVAEKLAKPVDILITTPASLKWLCADEQRSVDVKRKGLGLKLNRTRYCVIDECDITLDEKNLAIMRNELYELFDRRNCIYRKIYRDKEFPIYNRKYAEMIECQSSLQFCQMILVSATLPLSLSKYIENTFPMMKMVISNNFHSTVPTLQQNFYRINGSTTKFQALVEILKKAIKNGESRVLIFANKTQCVSLVTEQLVKLKFNVFSTDSKEGDHATHRKLLKLFLASPEKSSQEVIDVAMEENQLDPKKTMICVSTDITARGLDTTNVSHVILYDFPRTVIDYLHRAGRTARQGSYGQVTSIVSKKDVPLAQTIEYAAKKGKRLC